MDLNVNWDLTLASAEMYTVCPGHQAGRGAGSVGLCSTSPWYQFLKLPLTQRPSRLSNRRGSISAHFLFSTDS
jgi:hypothetical protein